MRRSTTNVPTRRSAVIALMALALTVLMATVPGNAEAATAVFTDTIASTATDWATPPAPPDPLTFPKFDPALGELQSITIALESGVDGDAAVENLSPTSASTATVNLVAAVEVDTMDPVAGVLSTLPTNTQTANLDVFDGTIDFAGPSGMSFSNLTATDSASTTLTSPAALALYTAAGGTITLPATASARSNSSGGGNVISQFSTNASATVTVTYTYLTPAITIEKTPDLQTIPSGLDATFTITVTNTGEIDLVNVAVTDPVAPGCDAVVGALAIGATHTYQCTLSAVKADVTNVATVTGETAAGTPVTDNDDAAVVVLLPAIDLVKTVNVQSATAGDVLTYTYVVTNTGAVTLTNVTLTDDKVGAITLPVTTLAPGESTTGTGQYTVTAADVASPPLINIATVTGTAPDGTVVSDQDTAEVPTLVLPTTTIATTTTTTTTTIATTTTSVPTTATLPATGAQDDLGSAAILGISLLALGAALVAALRRREVR